MLRHAFQGESTTSSEAYMKAARTHGDPHRLSAFFRKLLEGALCLFNTGASSPSLSFFLVWWMCV